ncbi:MAG: C39 family peptidase [Alphaproteobacteria bacterium]
MSHKKPLYLMGMIALALLLCGCEASGSIGMNDPATIAASAKEKDKAATPLAKKPDGATVIVDNGQKGESVDVGVISWRDLPFQTVKHQAFDYSCGSAAVATLMTFAYGIPTSEQDVFKEMFAQGNQDKIRKEGFSMLDMNRYLNAHGLESQGYKITEDAIEHYKLPVIALVNIKGYNHFVVVKAVDSGRVLVGDPNIGNTEYTKDGFAKIWNGIALIVGNKVSRAHMAYNDPEQWRFVRAHAPIRDGNDLGTQEAALAPTSWQIAPTMTNLLSSTTIGASLMGGL